MTQTDTSVRYWRNLKDEGFKCAKTGADQFEVKRKIGLLDEIPETTSDVDSQTLAKMKIEISDVFKKLFTVKYENKLEYEVEFKEKNCQ